MGGIGVISNPLSGRNKRNPRLVRRLAYILGEKGTLAQPKDFDHLDEVASRFKEHGVDIVCVHGGDGTIHKTLSALYRAFSEDNQGGDIELPMIAILKGGTMNTMARNVKLRLDAESMLGLVVRSYHSDAPFKIVERNLLVVDGTQAGLLFGTGVIARFLEAYYERGGGTWAAIRTLARGAFESAFGGPFIRWLYRYDPLRVEVDGEVWPDREYASVAAGTTPDIGLGFKAFQRSIKHPDHLHVLGFACSAWGAVTNVIPRMLWSANLDREDVPEAVARKVLISGKEPVAYMIDGDFFRGEQTLELRVGPRVRFIVG